MRGLDGKTALVTGGSRGIGAAISRELAGRGCSVLLTHVGDAGRAEALVAEITAAGGRATARESDVRDDAQVRQTVADAGPDGPDILVCNAGITRDGVLWKMTDEAWAAVLDVNLKGCFHCIRAAAPGLRKRGGGRIVAITSINGLRGKFGQANYAAAKGGLIALVKTAARELGRFGVTVNAVAPGMVDTEMAAALPAEVRARAEQETLLGRLAAPEDIAAVVAFLCSDGARHITGEVIKVDGGQYL